MNTLKVTFQLMQLSFGLMVMIKCIVIKCCHLLRINQINSKKFRTRFDQVNEIKFTVDSILKFAPYIKKIHIVTDNQTPGFLANSKIYKDKVSIVDHKIIFKGFEQYLPTFNCRSIETCIYRIPNLNEHFIYFNDDFF